MGSMTILLTKISLQISQNTNETTISISEHFEGTFTIYSFCLPSTFCSVHWSSVPLRCHADRYLPFWLFPCYAFWLLFLSCELILFFCRFCFPEDRRRDSFLNFVATCVTINWCYKIYEKFPISFPRASPNTLCGICIVFRHFTSNFLLVLQWL